MFYLGTSYWDSSR